MKSRERVLAALNHQQPDRVPRDLGSTTATGIHPHAYRALKRYLGLAGDFQFLSARAQLVLVEQPILDCFGIDCLPLIPDAAGQPIQLNEQNAFVDRWGIQRKLPNDGGHYYVSCPPLATIDELAELQSFKFPEPQTDFTVVAEQARRLRTTTDKALILNLEVGIMHQCQFLRGFEAWLMDLASDPRYAATLMDRVLEIWLCEAQAMIRAVGDNADVIVYADDIALQNSTMVSPRVYKTLLRPRLKQVFDALKSSGLKILYHTCGSVEPLIGDFLAMGVDALNPIQVSARGMDDTAALKRQWGRQLTFWGAIDSQHVLPRGAPEDVRREVFRRLDDLAHGGGYVLAAVHDIQAEVPPQNICAMFDAAEDWRASQTRWT